MFGGAIMGNENMRPVSRKMMFGIMGVLGLLLVGGVLISALKLFKPNEPEQQGDTSAQPSGIPAGITVEAQDVSRWVVSTTLIPPLDYHERQLRYLAVNRTVFLRGRGGSCRRIWHSSFQQALSSGAYALY
jgi:hypothetical protein